MVSKAHVIALTSGDQWLDEGANLLLIGPPGGGKSHLAAAIGVALVENGYRVFYSRTTDLAQRLHLARRDLSLERAIARLDKFHLLILDEFAYVTKDQAETSVLFELISARYEQRSLLITANQPFGQWDQIFPDHAMTVAAVDRGWCTAPPSSSSTSTAIAGARRRPEPLASAPPRRPAGGARGSEQDRGGQHAAVRPWTSGRANGPTGRHVWKGVGAGIVGTGQSGRACAEPASRPTAPRHGGGAERGAWTPVSTRAWCWPDDAASHHGAGVRHGLRAAIDAVAGVWTPRAPATDDRGLVQPDDGQGSGFTAGRLSWCYPAFTINPDWTAFRVSKIPSITFFFPPNSASGPPACRLLKGDS